MKVPFNVSAEYRGTKPGGEFKRDGVAVEYGPQARFEVDLPDGDVDTWSFAFARLDNVASFDTSKLKKGDRVHLVGIAGESRDNGMYVMPHSVTLAEGVKLAAAN